MRKTRIVIKARQYFIQLFPTPCIIRIIIKLVKKVPARREDRPKYQYVTKEKILPLVKGVIAVFSQQFDDNGGYVPLCMSPQTGPADSLPSETEFR